MQLTGTPGKSTDKARGPVSCSVGGAETRGNKAPGIRFRIGPASLHTGHHGNSSGLIWIFSDRKVSDLEQRGIRKDPDLIQDLSGLAERSDLRSTPSGCPNVQENNEISSSAKTKTKIESEANDDKNPGNEKNMISEADMDKSSTEDTESELSKTR